jgi:hypothetical protein
MPYNRWGCSKCGKQAPKKLREHGNFSERMKWLRDHYAESHPIIFKQWGKS